MDPADVHGGRASPRGVRRGTVADLSIGQPLEAPEAIVEAFAAASRERFRGRFGYMPNLGYPDVRERAAEDVDFLASRATRSR